jgi:adiponectin receptor
MACKAPAVAIGAFEGAVSASTSATPTEETPLIRSRRRHSFQHARRSSCDYDAEAVFLRVSGMPFY